MMWEMVNWRIGREKKRKHLYRGRNLRIFWWPLSKVERNFMIESMFIGEGKFEKHISLKRKTQK